MLDDLLARLERERQEADRLYNDAWTALDRLGRKAPALPAAPPASTGAALAGVRARSHATIEAPPGDDRSLKGRARHFIWRVVGPSFQGQQHFNAAVVEQLEQSAAASRDTERILTELLERLRAELDALEGFEARLLEYLRTVTAYIDTRDRIIGGPDIRERLSQAEHRLLAMKRDLEGGPKTTVAPAGEAFTGSVDAVTYVGFEDRYRGSRELIRSRVDEYVPLLSAASDVVDIGCGRGELLEALKARGVRARGVDANPAMVEMCRSRGLDAVAGDALGFLQQQSDASIGGLVAIQVVEHFTPAYLVQFLQTAHHKMRAGAPLILETINPASWLAFFESYIRDITHQRPLHPDTLRFLVESNGFTSVDVRYQQPVPDQHRLDRVGDPPADAAPVIRQLGDAVNAHADKLNARLFAPTDYVVVARR